MPSTTVGTARRRARAGSTKASTMSKRIYILLTASLFAFPAVAQTRMPAPAAQKQCADQFKAADLDNDGVLSGVEIGSASQLPRAVAGIG